MKKRTVNSILFISYSLILAVLSTAYMENKTYMLNFYILPVLLGAYYYAVIGGITLASIASALTVFFAHRAGFSITDTAVMVKLIIFAIIGVVAGILQKENNKLSNYLLRASLTDNLTGLYNFGFFDNRIKEEIARADRYKRSVGLIMIDIDHFKEYNDMNGHQKGNLVLQKIASILKTNVRKSDVVFRYGGEEFCVILPETREDAHEIAERLRKSVGREEFYDKGAGKRHISISAGVSYYPWHKKTGSSLVEMADKALYKAKETGRDRVCLFVE